MSSVFVFSVESDKDKNFYFAFNQKRIPVPNEKDMF